MQLISLHVNNNLLALDSSKVWSSSWRNRPTTTSQTKAQLVAVGPCCSVALWISMAARDWWSLGLGRKGKGSGCLCLCWIRGSTHTYSYYYVLVLCFLATHGHARAYPFIPKAAHQCQHTPSKDGGHSAEYRAVLQLLRERLGEVSRPAWLLSFCGSPQNRWSKKP